MPVGSTGQRVRGAARKHSLHVGFVPLIDAAPLIAAGELGYFADEGLDVHLDQQIGWGNIRDKLTYGQLHASHALAGMPPASVAGMEYYHEPLVGLMALGSGGNAVTVTPALAQFTDGANTMALWRKQLGRPLNLAHVFSTSTHHYFLRDMLYAAGLLADRDANLCVMPPPQLVGHLQAESLDGFCVGEPWNTLALLRNSGTIVTATTELAPDHPEKVLAVTRRWYEQNRVTAERLVRATIRGCDFCENVRNRSRLTEMLADRMYLDMDEKVIDKSLSIDEWFKPGIRRPRFRSFSRETTVPRIEQMEWVVRQMIRWGQLPHGIDIGRIAAASVVEDVYTEAVSGLQATDAGQKSVHKAAGKNTSGKEARHAWTPAGVAAGATEEVGSH